MELTGVALHCRFPIHNGARDVRSNAKFYRDGHPRRTQVVRQRDNALPGDCTMGASEALSCCPFNFVDRQQRQRFRCHFGGLANFHFSDLPPQATLLLGVLPSR